ncbi:MAG: peptide/nickel transport system ATP-binding protein [Paraglaciecola psychrophila]|jgi:peptide/nickel transport system ATP-binding protein
MNPPLLEIEEVSVDFATDEGTVRAVEDISFCLTAGTTLGIVGESGCGKSVTALSIMGLLPQPAGTISSGHIKLNGEDLTLASSRRLAAIRGAQIGMVFQEPMTALNPVHTIGKQLTEVLLLHSDSSSQQALLEASNLLERVGIPSPAIRLGEYPHQLSGGMRQRVVIAMALACNPALLIADEPTTALDVTIQAQILALLKELQQQRGTALLLITHDLGVIAEMCDTVVVMYAGKVVEQASVYDLFDQPKHPYTQGLLASMPTLDTPPKSRLPTIEGMVPGLRELPAGCRFSNRCHHRQAACEQRQPDIDIIANGHTVSCFRWSEL